MSRSEIFSICILTCAGEVPPRVSLRSIDLLGDSRGMRSPFTSGILSCHSWRVRDVSGLSLSMQYLTIRPPFSWAFLKGTPWRTRYSATSNYQNRKTIKISWDFLKCINMQNSFMKIYFRTVAMMKVLMKILLCMNQTMTNGLICYFFFNDSIIFKYNKKRTVKKLQQQLFCISFNNLIIIFLNCTPFIFYYFY